MAHEVFIESIEEAVVLKGYANLTKRLSETFKDEEPKRRVAIRREVLTIILSTGKYSIMNETDGMLVYRNPNFELNEISKRTSMVQRKALRITIGIGIVTLIVTGTNVWLTLKYQQKQLLMQERQLHLTLPPIIIDSVVVHQSRTDTTK